MEGLFANTHQLKGKMKEKIESSEEIGLLCKKLVTIITDVPIDFDEEVLKYTSLNIFNSWLLRQELYILSENEGLL